MHTYRNAKGLLCIAVISLTTLASARGDEAVWTPVVDGKWWKIADDDPDVSPFKIVTDHKTNVCDFTIFRDATGRWQLIACVRQTDAPGERVFHRWEGAKLEDKSWQPKGIFPCERGERGKPSAPTSVQAPHCVRSGDKYYLFYNSSGARCMTSNDGRSWQQAKNVQGDSVFFPMGRDVCVFNDQSNNRWLAYYCGPASNQKSNEHAMVARTAEELEGPWSERADAVREEGNPESPFVVHYKGKYYLWQQMSVYMSDDPLKFRGPPIAHMTGTWFSGKYAPEVIEHEGQYYIAGYSDGIWLAKFGWVKRTPAEIDAWRTEWEAYLKREREKRSPPKPAQEDAAQT